MAVLGDVAAVDGSFDTMCVPQREQLWAARRRRKGPTGRTRASQQAGSPPFSDASSRPSPVWGRAGPVMVIVEARRPEPWRGCG
jgi:hypothetical protein